MQQIAFKIMAFSLVLNLGIGLFGYIGGSYFSYGSATYQSDYGEGDLGELQETIGGAPVEDSNNWGDKILDFFSLGLYSKVKGFANNMLYGFLNFLFNIGLIDTVLKVMLQGLVTVIYVAGMYELFTGKSILG